MGFVAAADFDGSKPLLCASMELQECIPGVGCERVTTDSINAAEFFRIDVKKKTIVVSARNQSRPPQRIESSAITYWLFRVQIMASRACVQTAWPTVSPLTRLAEKWC
jgi:hypothetical protein